MEVARGPVPALDARRRSIRKTCRSSHAISAEPWDGGWFGAVELTIFRPYHNDLPVADRNDSVGPRLSLGWESDRGFGFRGRFWGMENESDMLGPLAALTVP